MTKWFFALSEASLGHADHDWENLIRAAVASARANTNLEPHFLYDGAPNAFTVELKSLGVTVVQHQVSYLGNIVERSHMIGKPLHPMHQAIIAGAYLRTEIPRLDIPDEFVLYTDCDVIFESDPQIDRFRPAFFACAPQFDPNNFQEINSGVMVMNVPGMRQEFANFYHYIVNHYETFGAHDQDALREYYNGRFDPLPCELNWKPYWGFNDAATIVHFHGPKPGAIRHLIEQPDYPVPEVWRTLYESHPDAYREYLRRWDTMLDKAKMALPS